MIRGSKVLIVRSNAFAAIRGADSSLLSRHDNTATTTTRLLHFGRFSNRTPGRSWEVNDAPVSPLRSFRRFLPNHVKCFSTASTPAGASSPPLHQQATASDYHDFDENVKRGDAFWQNEDLDSAQEAYESALTRLLQLEKKRRNIHNMEDPVEKTNIKKSKNPRMAAILHKLGSVHARRGHNQEAMLWYQQSLAIKLKLVDQFDLKNRNEQGGDVDDSLDTLHPPAWEDYDAHLEAGSTLNGIAMLQAGLGPKNDGENDSQHVDVDAALQTFEQAEMHTRCYQVPGQHDLKKVNEDEEDEEEEDEDGDEDEVGFLHPNLANICQNMAQLYVQTNKIEKALEYFLETLKVLRATNPITTTHNIKSNNDKDDDDSNGKFTKDEQSAMHEHHTLRMAHVILHAGTCQYQLNNLGSAIELYEEGLKLLTALHPDIYDNQNDNEENDEIPHASPTQISQLRQAHPETLHLQSQIHHYLGLVLVSSPPSSSSSSSRKSLATFDSAMAHHSTSYFMQRELWGATSTHAAQALQAMGACLASSSSSDSKMTEHEVRGNRSKAMSCFQEALRIYKVHARREVEKVQQEQEDVVVLKDGEDEKKVVDVDVEKAMETHPNVVAVKENIALLESLGSRSPSASSMSGW